MRDPAQDDRAGAGPGGGLPAPVRYLNLGGGFGIPYGEKDQPLDLAPIGANLAGLLDELVRPVSPTPA